MIFQEKTLLSEIITRKEDGMERLITLTDGTGMGDALIIFKTNAPPDVLRSLEIVSCSVYLNGGSYDDVPIWSDELAKKGYVFEYVDSCTHVTPYGTSSDWLENHKIGSKINEHYVIENQPDK